MDPEDETFSDWEEDDDEVVVKSLFSDLILPSILELVAYDKREFGFDLQDAVSALDFDDIAIIMLINFIRRRVKETTSPIDKTFVETLKSEIGSKAFLGDDSNMRPVLLDDPLLFSLRDAMVRAGRLVETDDDIEESNGTTAAPTASSASATASAGSAQLDEMQQTLSKYQSLITALTSDTADEAGKPNDAYYFDGYSHVSIHETMLRDAPRTTSYAEALMANADFVRGKTVLDVGCGTGILCMLAARAGAKKVIGVDMSSMIERARRVVERNGFSDVITLVRGRLEDLDLPVEDGEVDIIVSEWMGYGLYFENMLSSVLHARDHYLSPAGVLMPSDAVVSIEGLSASGSDDRINWWKDVYGFDMTDIADLLTVEAQVQFVDAEEVVTTQYPAHKLNIRDAQDKDLDFTVGFNLKATADAPLQAFVISFDVIFAGNGFSKEVTLSTAPAAEPTHWKQTVLWLHPENRSDLKIGDVIEGRLVYQRKEDNARDYDITVVWKVLSISQGGGAEAGAEATPERTQKYLLAA